MKYFNDFYKFIQKYFIPPRVYHWQSLLLLGIFLWALAALNINSEWKVYLSNLGSIFLIVAIGWRTTEKPFIIGDVCLSPWITGGLISWFIAVNLSQDRQPFAIIAWPLFSLCIAALLEWEKIAKFKNYPPSIRPKILIFIFIHLLITCWLGFHFLIAVKWLNNYPSILAEDLSRSGFVIRTQPRSINNSRGLLMVKLMEVYLENRTRNRPWYEVETWLIEISNKRISLVDEALKNLPQVSEDSLWELKTTLVQGQSRYQLGLLAKWRGLTSEAEQYLLTKYCEITKIGTESQLECGPVQASDLKPKNNKSKPGVKV